jgi:glucose-6-phosphate 1-epimerase
VGKEGKLLETLEEGIVMTIAQLNTDYGIDGQLQFIEGKGGFPLIEISNAQATATISVYAGQVLKFQPTGASADVLFLSDSAYYQAGKAIKGGVPICWPWFGPDPEGKGRASHGFVRDRQWQVIATQALSDGRTQVTLGLTDTDETRELWPHAFNFQIVITVGTQLHIELVTKNTGSVAFSITQALHTYFTVGDIQQTSVMGLSGCEYLDKVDGGQQKAQVGAVTIAQEVDRVYLNVPSQLTINDAALNRKIQIDAIGSKTAIVWNPWIDICAKMADLDDQDYQRFICVETANAANEVIEVPAGGEYRLGATIAIG